MSRNKDIKYLHELTGWSYKYCRQKMKENHWDWWKAWGLGDVVENTMDALQGALNAVYESFEKVAKDFVEAFSKIDWQKIKEELDEYNRQIDLESLPEEISGKTIGTKTD